jgi:hypothetical protein
LHVCNKPCFVYIAKLFVAKTNLVFTYHSCLGANSQWHHHGIKKTFYCFTSKMSICSS